MNDLVPIGFLQVQQTKHFSCHCLVLYSIFFIPALKTSPHPSHLVANCAS